MARDCPAFVALKHRVTLQRISRAEDGQGGFTETWDDIATLWASIEPLKGYERMQAMQLKTPTTHRVRLRYRADVTTKDRLIYDGRAFDVAEAINEGEAKLWLRLSCVETN